MVLRLVRKIGVTYLSFILVVLLALTPLQGNSQETDVWLATCKLIPSYPYEAPNISGFVTFNTTGTNTWVTVNVTGLPSDEEYALHIHYTGDPYDPQMIYVGEGEASPHACPPQLSEAGNLGNWQATNGSINSTSSFQLLSLFGSYSVIGRVLLLVPRDTCQDNYVIPTTGLAWCVIATVYTRNDSIVNNALPSSGETFTNAVAILNGTSTCPTNSCTGEVWFHLYPVTNSKVLVTAYVENCLNVSRGLHIQQYGDLTWPNGFSSGTHWSIPGVSHELPPTTPRHFGDLGNVQSFDSNGNGWYYMIFDNFFPSFESLIGRAVTIHQMVDRGAGIGCDQTGDTGQRPWMGVIGWAIGERAEGNLENGDEAYGVLSIPQEVTINNNFVVSSCNQTVEIANCVFSGGGVLTISPLVLEDGTGSETYKVTVTSNVKGEGEYGLSILTTGEKQTDNCISPENIIYTISSNLSVNSAHLINFTTLISTIEADGNNSVIGRSVVITKKENGCDFIENQCTIGISQPQNTQQTNVAINDYLFPNGISYLYGTTNCPFNCSGMVFFHQLGNFVQITAIVEGLELSSIHGIHIHEFGDLSDNSGGRVGNHFNPDNMMHGLPIAHESYHLGDLGNIQNYDINGFAIYQFNSTSLSQRLHSIIGRSIVISQRKDSGKGQNCDQTGSSGVPLLMGVIGIANSDLTPTQSSNWELNNTWADSSCGGGTNVGTRKPTDSSNYSSTGSVFPSFCLFFFVMLLFFLNGH